MDTRKPSPAFRRVQSDGAEGDIQCIHDLTERFAQLQADIEDMADKRHTDGARVALREICADLDSFRHDFVRPLSMVVDELKEQVDA